MRCSRRYSPGPWSCRSPEDRHVLQATAAIADFMLILLTAGLWVAGVGAAALVGAVAATGAVILTLRGLIRRRRLRG